MIDTDFILETLATFVLLVYYLVEGFVKVLVPSKWIQKKELAGETVLVTGSGSGMGRLLSIKLAKIGCNLVLWDVNEQGNQETAAEIREFGGKATPYTVDLSKREQIYEVAAQVKKDVGDVTILINNAGIVTGKKFLQCPDNLIIKSMEVNAHSHFWTTKAFLPAMLERNHGHIVSLASSAGLTGVCGLADYCASKFAAVGFMESLYLELKTLHKSIECTTVCPYFVNTGMFDGVLSRFPKILPILDAEYVVDQIVEAIQTNQTVLYTPKILYSLFALKGFLPTKASLLLNRYFGTTASMDQFKGRASVKSD